MAIIKNHDLRVLDGRTIVMPAWKGGQSGFGNLKIPDIRDVDTIQQYPVGTKLLDNERVFYYAKAAGNGVTATGKAVKQVYPQAVGFRAITVAQVAGDKEIVFVTASPDGFGGAGTVTEDELAGGFIIVFPGNNDEFVSRIVSNTLAATASMTVTLQDEIPTTVAIGEHAECMANQFLNLETHVGNIHTPAAGVSHVKVTAGQWFWVQTWGPTWISPASGVLGAGQEFEVRFYDDGALRDEDSTYNEGFQRAGYGLARAPGGGQGAPFFFLQITP